MSRSPILFTLAVFALALLAVPAALAKNGNHRDVRIQGVCTQQSTSKLKLKREDRGTRVEFEVDQNRSGVPWTVTLSVNDTPLTSFTATTRAPSGSFEIRRLIAGLLRTDRITAVATQADSGETCTAGSSTPKTSATTPTVVNPTGDNDDDDNGDDNGGSGSGGGHGHDSGGDS